MCDNAMTYNRPDTVYYKLAKKILHAGFKMMSKVRSPQTARATAARVLPVFLPRQKLSLSEQHTSSHLSLATVWTPLP